MTEGSDSDSDSAHKLFKKERDVIKVTRPVKGHNVLAISVIDTGCGINNNGKVKLFKLFGTLQDTRQMNTQGIGLGLVISKMIVEQFDGVIDFISKF